MSSNNTIEENAFANDNVSDHWPKDVGIIALDVYFPNTYVSQQDLEKFNGVGEGKYTIGLGQKSMAFCTDREDINSICLSVTKSLLEKYSISPKDVGFLMIGTETIIDKSKSVKTLLMELFIESGNTDIQGLHTTNACYGGTAALFHAIDWIESSSWDGRYAIVVCGDIAVYAKGPARPTGGCSAVAMLVGPNAPIVFDRRVRSTFMSNIYDFYKPIMDSEYSIVDGHLANQCYIEALDKCFHLYLEKANKQIGPVALDNFDAILFHAPYSKIVQKSMARLFLLDFHQNPGKYSTEINKQLGKYMNVKLKETYCDRELEKILLILSKESFEKKTKPSLILCENVGNAYTASIWGCLIAYLLGEPINQNFNKRLLFFSYGSGMAASMFSARVHSSQGSAQSSLIKLLKVISDIPNILNKRLKVSAQRFEDTLNMREETYNRAPYIPFGPIDELRVGTYYLSSINDKYVRSYERIPNNR